MQNIPKIIHYCWFGGKPLPDEYKKYIDSWKKYCPDWEIREWNESNFDFSSCEYAMEAYDAKKWAFVSDYARFKILYEGSDIYRVNSSGEHGETVSSETYDELRTVCDVYSDSHGKAAALSGALTELWGFDTDEFRLPSEDEILSAKEKCGDDKLIFDDGKKVYIPDGAKLNLGSAGKGIALDEAVKRIEEINSQGGKITGAVISVGGSVATYGLPKKGKSWNVGIRDPYKTENDYFAVLSLTDAFISTSGDYEKRFTAEDGKTYFHILDLTTGYPVQTELTSVTIKAPTGLLSDALSTLCFILGKEESLPILEKYNADAVFVYKDRTVFATDGIKPYLKITNGDYSLV